MQQAPDGATSHPQTFSWTFDIWFHGNGHQLFNFENRASLGEFTKQKKHSSAFIKTQRVVVVVVSLLHSWGLYFFSPKHRPPFLFYSLNRAIKVHLGALSVSTSPGNVGTDMSTTAGGQTARQGAIRAVAFSSSSGRLISSHSSLPSPFPHSATLLRLLLRPEVGPGTNGIINALSK